MPLSNRQRNASLGESVPFFIVQHCKKNPLRAQVPFSHGPRTVRASPNGVASKCDNTTFSFRVILIFLKEN